MSATSAEQPEPIITPTSNSAAAPSPPADVAVLARRRQSRPNSKADAAAAPIAAPPATPHSESCTPVAAATSIAPSAPTDAPPATPRT
jgi:hypothetical protein